VGPLFGLPFVTGSLPHSPQFVRALALAVDKPGAPPVVAENRVAPLLMYATVGLLRGRVRFGLGGARARAS
jgi:hypothetical protein